MRALNQLKSSGASLLAISSVLASILNFYSFLVFPVVWPSEQLGIFIQHNYLGGSYMAIIGSSIIPMSIFLLNNGGRFSFRNYFLISFFILFVVVVVGANFTFFPYTYYGLGAAILLHLQGLPLALMIRQERTNAVFLCVLVQPFVFAVLLTLGLFFTFNNISWIYFWFIASIASVIFFFYMTGWKEIIFFMKRDDIANISLNSLLSRMFVASAFPIFFQLELILVGNYSSIDLTEFAIFQKLYISISVSLFSNLSVLLIAQDLKTNGSLSVFPDIRAFLLGFFSMVVVISVGYAMTFIDSSERLEVSEIFVVGLVSIAFTVCSYMNLRQVQTKPMLAGISFFVAITTYVVIFYTFTPESIIDLMFLSTIYFILYILISTFIGLLYKYL